MISAGQRIPSTYLSQKRVRKTSNPSTTKRVKKSSIDSSESLNFSTDGSQDIEMASRSGPYRPDDKERERYYYGLAGNPRLVARTSDNLWSEPQHVEGWNDRTVQTPKRYLPIVEHELVPKWTNGMCHEIIKALGQCVWSYFFPVTICLDDRAAEERSTVRHKPSTVLLIAVEENSLQWEEGITIALECRKILRASQVYNIEVEIREGRYHHHAASAKFEAQIDAEAWGTQTNRTILPMLSSLGYPVGYFDELPGAGTMGLHLRLEDEKPAVYGLTCRHVVYNDRAPEETYKPSGEHRQYHVQANHYAFNKCLDGLESIRKDLAAHIKPLQDEKDRWEQWYMHDETLKHKCPTKQDIDLLRVYQEEADYNTKIIDLLETIEDKKDRKIGHLAFHPNFEVSSRQPGYLRDWALIELDPHKFTHSPENKVFIGYYQTQISDRRLDNGFLTLRLKDEDEVDALSTYPVAKRGATTGLTFGTKSSIEAVVRHPTKDGRPAYTWEMLIVPPWEENKLYKFSKKGDSGSCVFDERGFVVGLVVGSSDAKSDDWRGIPVEGSNSQKLKRYPGNDACPSKADETKGGEMDTWPDGTDVTFVAPIQWVLKDIRDFTGLQPRLA
ncbi:putative Peptidase S7 domain-containing protein [Seiridium unicorne]|uniref:Peptidase S7 domain-containing protein n=1 Tax=Seiridium unicorne TaxID=138068 RepID=A0ABR2UI56_9PEZI